MKGVGMLVGNFELNPLKETDLGVAQVLFLPLKETMLKHRQYNIFYIFSRGTLNETFTASEVRSKSEIYTPKRDDEHPIPFI